MSATVTITCAMQCSEKCHGTITFPDTSSIVKHVEDVAISGWSTYGKTAICYPCLFDVSAGERRNVDVAREIIARKDKRIAELEKKTMTELEEFKGLFKKTGVPTSEPSELDDGEVWIWVGFTTFSLKTTMGNPCLFIAYLQLLGQRTGSSPTVEPVSLSP